MSDVHINRREIERLTREIQQEFDKHPIRVPVQADSPALPRFVRSTTTIFNGPVIHGSANGAQLAWGNDTVHQTHNRQQIAPGYEAIAAVVAKTLERLPDAGLAEEDRQAAEGASRDVLAEVTQAEPDRGKVRRAISSLKGFLAPVAMGLVAGGADGAREWARVAIEQLGRPF